MEITILKDIPSALRINCDNYRCTGNGTIIFIEKFYDNRPYIISICVRNEFVKIKNTVM